MGRQQATSQTKVDTRKHPLPTEAIDTRSDLRICGMPGDMLKFSSAHLHSTAPNTSGQTRFGIDFRTLSIDALEAGCGARNVDSRARGTTLGDFLRADDFSKIAPEMEPAPHAALRALQGNHPLPGRLSFTAADRIGVTAETVLLENALPAEAIIETARARDCSLIAMASHGRRGLGRLMMGSVTAEVLAHSAVPVLVVR